jgi:hypothetical protein
MVGTVLSEDDESAEISVAKQSATPVGSQGPAGEQLEMPLPSDFSGIFQGGLFMLAFLAAIYAAREIVLPVVLASILKLLLQPAVRLLERLHVPRIELLAKFGDGMKG